MEVCLLNLHSQISGKERGEATYQTMKLKKFQRLCHSIIDVRVLFHLCTSFCSVFFQNSFVYYLLVCLSQCMMYQEEQETVTVLC